MPFRLGAPERPWYVTYGSQADQSAQTAAQARPQPAARSPFPAKKSLAARTYFTARGAMVAMFALFLFCVLVAGWMGFEVLAGLAYIAACVTAPRYVRKHALLQIVVAPPAIFLTALIVAQVLTAQGSSRHGRVLSVAEGTVLTLAGLAPWLLAGTALGAIAAVPRGLMGCLRELRAELAPSQRSWAFWRR
jgi:hypothetical protein